MIVMTPLLSWSLIIIMLMLVGLFIWLHASATTMVKTIETDLRSEPTKNDVYDYEVSGL